MNFMLQDLISWPEVEPRLSRITLYQSNCNDSFLSHFVAVLEKKGEVEASTRQMKVCLYC